jgi:hypothetical protein
MKIEILEKLIKQNAITLKEALVLLDSTESSKFENRIINYWTSTYTYPINKNSVLFFS